MYVFTDFCYFTKKSQLSIIDVSRREKKKCPSPLLTDDKELQVFVYQMSVPISAGSRGKYL